MRWHDRAQLPSSDIGPDGYAYRIDSYIVYVTRTNGRQLMQITVVVRDGNMPSRTFARLPSTFDQTVGN